MSKNWRKIDKEVELACKMENWRGEKTDLNPSQLADGENCSYFDSYSLDSYNATSDYER